MLIATHQTLLYVRSGRSGAKKRAKDLLSKVLVGRPAEQAAVEGDTETVTREQKHADIAIADAWYSR